MNHSAMDSWYLHHSLFNVARMAHKGHQVARSVFEQSLPYMIRVAHRFDYRWPVFFDLASLDIIRAEAEPGKGGETDVAGFYALVMLHAHEIFGDERYLDEAKAAAARLEGLGFELAYQLNTTGFAAEAMMRLWKITKLPHYLALSEVCMANLFDNMWLWRCEYGKARHYQTFFGLFPLRDAPYLAPYEELEAHAKFHEYLALGGDDVRPSLRLLIAEFQKHGLDRGWYFYPTPCRPTLWRQKFATGRTWRRFLCRWKTYAMDSSSLVRSVKKSMVPGCHSCTRRGIIWPWLRPNCCCIPTIRHTTSAKATAARLGGSVGIRVDRASCESYQRTRMSQQQLYVLTRRSEKPRCHCAARFRPKAMPCLRREGGSW